VVLILETAQTTRRRVVMFRAMDFKPVSVLRWLFDSRYGASAYVLPRWLFLRALGVIYFSAFLPLIFQIRGLIGPDGILPAGNYLQALTNSVGFERFWYAPTLLWFSASSRTLMTLCWVGLLAAVLLILNIWPRGTLLICFVCFLSFVTAASEFSGYQSDGMLLEAGFLSLFLAPSGLRPRLGKTHPPMRAAMFLLLWEWFRIYFESGVAKIASGDPEWRNFTAMDEYYQNGPLPTWIGWYVQHLPHGFHAATAFGTLALELALVWMLFLPRRVRIICFFIVTPWQIGVILTANYTFLNYLVLCLGIFLLDDKFLLRFVPLRWKSRISPASDGEVRAHASDAPFESASLLQTPGEAEAGDSDASSGFHIADLKPYWEGLKLGATALILCWLFYSSTTLMLWMIFPGSILRELPAWPVAALEPFRVAERYGLFARMTRGRYEIEFQGSNDGTNWVTYPFHFKPQDPAKAPGIYAPYQPRFEWNLWFASLGTWHDNPFVPRTGMRILQGSPYVLAANPFPQQPPRQVRAILWQYWFSTAGEKRTQGVWWRREFLGVYAPTLEREPDGRIIAVDWPPDLPPHE
jgi:lipase maturation factor 1